MANKEFIKRLRLAKENLRNYSEYATNQLVLSCRGAGIYWSGWRPRNATFDDNKIFSMKYLLAFSKETRRAASITIIDASIAALQNSAP